MRISSSTIAVLASSIALAGAIPGCGGGSAEMKPVTSTTATGQQLVDLKKALDAGAITQDQYEREKARILKGN